MAGKIGKEELIKKLETVEQPFDPSPELWKQLAPGFAMVVMSGAMRAVLKLDDEAKNMVLSEAGAGWNDFVQAHIMEWAPGQVPWDDITKATMSGAFRGIRKLDEKNKEAVLREMGATCLHTMLAAYASWEAAGIPLSEGSYDVDSANVLLEHILSTRKIWRDGDTVFYESNVGPKWGKCACSLYQSGITEPVPELCQCATLTMKTQYDYLTGIPWEAELVDSITHGNEGTCSFRMHCKPTRYTVR